MLTEKAIEGYKVYTERTISHARYRLGSTCPSGLPVHGLSYLLIFVQVECEAVEDALLHTFDFDVLKSKGNCMRSP